MHQAGRADLFTYDRDSRLTHAELGAQLGDSASTPTMVSRRPEYDDAISGNERGAKLAGGRLRAVVYLTTVETS